MRRFLFWVLVVGLVAVGLRWRQGMKEASRPHVADWQTPPGPVADTSASGAASTAAHTERDPAPGRSSEHLHDRPAADAPLAADPEGGSLRVEAMETLPDAGEHVDEWDADASWESELAFHVWRDHGAFDVDELGPPMQPRKAERLPNTRLAPEATSEPREPDRPAGAQPSASELERLPRQALFELARESGISPQQRILMSRRELLDALAEHSVIGEA